MSAEVERCVSWEVWDGRAMRAWVNERGLEALGGEVGRTFRWWRVGFAMAVGVVCDTELIEANSKSNQDEVNHTNKQAKYRYENEIPEGRRSVPAVRLRAGEIPSERKLGRGSAWF